MLGMYAEISTTLASLAAQVVEDRESLSRLRQRQVSGANQQRLVTQEVASILQDLVRIVREQNKNVKRISDLWAASNTTSRLESPLSPRLVLYLRRWNLGFPSQVAVLTSRAESKLPWIRDERKSAQELLGDTEVLHIDRISVAKATMEKLSQDCSKEILRLTRTEEELERTRVQILSQLEAWGKDYKDLSTGFEEHSKDKTSVKLLGVGIGTGLLGWGLAAVCPPAGAALMGASFVVNMMSIGSSLQHR